jgi:threonine dehydrogenase-like Zn-dependent dehydrogenase
LAASSLTTRLSPISGRIALSYHSAAGDADANQPQGADDHRHRIADTAQSRNIAMKSRAMVQVADRHYVMQEVEVPRLRPDEALLRVEICGMCGSDIEQYRGHFTKKGLVTYPLIPGHEPVGVIEEIGSEAAARWRVKTGDRVALEPHITCGRCTSCLAGNYHLCRNNRRAGTMSAYGYMTMEGGKGLYGGYAEYIHLLPPTILHRVPKEIPLGLASIYQLLASGIRWAVDVPRTEIGDSVLVLGCGQRGLGSVIACREAGAATIIVTGLACDRHKLDLALALGATHTIVADKEDVVARVMEITGGQGVNTAVDVVPVSTHPIVQAMDVVQTGGTIVLAGIKGEDISVALDTDKIVMKEIRIQGVLTQTNTSYRRAIQMLAQNKYDLGRLHTHEFKLEQVVEAITTLAGERHSDRPAISVSISP